MPKVSLIHCEEPGYTENYSKEVPDGVYVNRCGLFPRIFPETEFSSATVGFHGPRVSFQSNAYDPVRCQGFWGNTSENPKEIDLHNGHFLRFSLN